MAINLEPGGANPPTAAQKQGIKTTLGLELVDNVPDSQKPVSTAQAAADAAVASAASADATSKANAAQAAAEATASADATSKANAAQAAAEATASADATSKANAAQAAAVTPAVYDAGNITGTVALDWANGHCQKAAVTGHLTLNAPTNGGENKSLTIWLTPNNSWDLNFNAAILIPTDSALSLPKTLTTNKLYIVKLIHNGTAWMLTTIVGGY